MQTCDEATAKFMSKALLEHAREISRYARTYGPVINPNDEKKAQKYSRTVTRLIAGMNSLLLMAERKGISRYCNREQIDAYIEEARQLVQPVQIRKAHSLCNMN